MAAHKEESQNVAILNLSIFFTIKLIIRGKVEITLSFQSPLLKSLKKYLQLLYNVESIKKFP